MQIYSYNDKMQRFEPNKKDYIQKITEENEILERKQKECFKRLAENEIQFKEMINKLIKIQEEKDQEEKNNEL